MLCLGGVALISGDIERLNQIIKQVPPDKRPVAEHILKELIFMSETLENLKATIKEKGEIDLFKQGKQEFLRESPAMKTYNTTVQRYGLLFKQFTDLLPKTDFEHEDSALLDFMNEE